MDYHYRMNCGQYVLHDGEDPIGPVMDEVAIAFDLESGTLHKHGSPEMVRAWCKKSSDKLIQAGFPEMAGDLVVIAGRFPVEELNKCLSITGYVRRMYDRASSGEISSQPLLPEA